MRILIIEDTEAMRWVLKEYIEDAGYKIVGEATDGKEGLKKYKELNPDLVILDIALPHMSGIDCIKAIKEHNKEAKIIICSALDKDQFNADIKNLEHIQYIEKTPFKRKIFIQMLKDIEVTRY